MWGWDGRAVPQTLLFPTGAAFDTSPKIWLGLASSDPSCLTALSTCPSLQTHKQFACLSWSQGSCISSHPNSEDFSWRAVNDAVLALSRIPAPTCRNLAPACSAWELLLLLLKHRNVRGLFSHNQNRDSQVWPRFLPPPPPPPPNLTVHAGWGRGAHCSGFACFWAHLVLTSRHFAHNSLPVWEPGSVLEAVNTEPLCWGIVLFPRARSGLAHAVWPALRAASLTFHAFLWNLDSDVKILCHTIKVAFPCPLAHQSCLVNRALSSLAFAVWNNWSLQFTCQQ